jgi:hypothetical protein
MFFSFRKCHQIWIFFLNQFFFIIYNLLYCSLECKETHTSEARLWLLFVIYYTKPMMLIACFTQCGFYVFPSWLCLWSQTKIFHHLFKIFHNCKISFGNNAMKIFIYTCIIVSYFIVYQPWAFSSGSWTQTGHHVLVSHIKTIHAKHQFYLIILIQMSTNLSNKLILK